MPPLESLVARIRGEYREMPGLRLTFAQACRLWQVDGATCQMLLEQRVRENFLHKTDNEAYVAQSTTPVPVIYPAVVNALARLTGKRYRTLPLVTV